MPAGAGPAAHRPAVARAALPPLIGRPAATGLIVPLLLAMIVRL